MTFSYINFSILIHRCNQKYKKKNRFANFLFRNRILKYF